MDFDVIDLGNNIILYKNKNNMKYKVLLAGLFHGDENCLDIIFYYMKNGFHDISLSFIPVINKEKTRENKDKENINCSFNHPNCKTVEQTKESKIIIDNIELIKECSKNGYASLHINKKAKENYSHIWFQGDPPKEMIKELNVYDYNLCYNTLEDYLWHEGIPIGACIEFSNTNRIEFLNNFLEWIRRINESNILC